MSSFERGNKPAVFLNKDNFLTARFSRWILFLGVSHLVSNHSMPSITNAFRNSQLAKCRSLLAVLKEGRMPDGSTHIEDSKASETSEHTSVRSCPVPYDV